MFCPNCGQAGYCHTSDVMSAHDNPRTMIQVDLYCSCNKCHAKGAYSILHKFSKREKEEIKRYVIEE